MYWNYLIQTSQSCDISPLSERSLVLFLKSCCRYHALNKPENTHLLRKRKYHWMADLLFEWLGLSCFAYVELMFYKHGPIPTSQTGGQTYCQCSLHFFTELLDCRQSQNCDVNAACEFNKTRELFACVCKKGFTGNGITCRQETGKL